MQTNFTNRQNGKGVNLRANTQRPDPSGRYFSSNLGLKKIRDLCDLISQAENCGVEIPTQFHSDAMTDSPVFRYVSNVACLTSGNCEFGSNCLQDNLHTSLLGCHIAVFSEYSSIIPNASIDIFRAGWPEICCVKVSRQDINQQT